MNHQSNVLVMRVRNTAIMVVATSGTGLVVAAGSCGGRADPSVVTLLDGAVVTLPPGALCEGWDASMYLSAVLNPPTCDPDLVVDAGLSKGNENPVCVQWTHTFGLPLLPSNWCNRVGEAGVCALTGGLADDEPKAACRSATDENKEGDAYCSALFAQLVRGGGSTTAFCTPYTEPLRNQSPHIVGWCGPFNYGSSKCGLLMCPLFDTATNPPTPQVCVERNGTARCEHWCQDPP